MLTSETRVMYEDIREWNEILEYAWNLPSGWHDAGRNNIPEVCNDSFTVWQRWSLAPDIIRLIY